MRKAVITGASKGLGHAIASKLIAEGVDVINLSRTPSDLKVTNLKTDITKNNEISKALETIMEKHSDIDLLILCAGVGHVHDTGKIPIEDIDTDFAVNITGLIKVTDGLIQIIRKNKGDIVIIGSTSSYKSYPGWAVYTATKHAVLGYTKYLQMEMKNEDVRVIGFHPGGFKSQFHKKAKSNIQLDELMDPEELADLLIRFLKLPRNMEVSEIIINRRNPK